MNVVLAQTVTQANCLEDAPALRQERGRDGAPASAFASVWRVIAFLFGASLLAGTPAFAQSVIRPTFSAEVHSATDGAGAAFNSSTLSLNVSGTSNLLIAAWHAEFDGGTPDAWTVTCNGIPGTPIVDTDGYTGGAGNRRFRIYYWVNPPQGNNTIVVSNPYTGPNELSVSVVLLAGVDPTNPIGAPSLDVSTAARTGETETVPTATGDLVVHVIADALVITGTLGSGETSVSLANDGKHSPPDGDASLWLSTKPGGAPSTTVSSGGWASRIINGAAFAVHGISSTQPSPPALQAAVSRKVHGGAGTFDLPLSLVSANPTTEPRQGPTQTIVLTFDKPVTSATVSVTEGTATAGAPTFSGNDVIVGLTGVANRQYATILLTGIASADGGSGGSALARIGFLVGDVNQSRVVTFSDLVLANAQLTKPVTALNFLKDVNASGSLTFSDLVLINANLAHSLPAP